MNSLVVPPKASGSNVSKVPTQMILTDTKGLTIFVNPEIPKRPSSSLEAKTAKKSKKGKENEQQGYVIKKCYVMCPEPLCSKQISKKGLRQHMETHKDKRAYGCNQCDYRANTKDYL